MHLTHKSQLLRENPNNVSIRQYTENEQKAFMLYGSQKLLVFNEEQKREEEAVLFTETYMPKLDIKLEELFLRETTVSVAIRFNKCYNDI